MKVLLVFFSCFVSAVLLASCGRKGAAVSTSSVGTQAPTGITNLTAAMSDDQILRALGLDPAKASARVTQGKDGQSTEYSAGDDRVVITRSIVSGLSVMRGAQVWALGKP
jgi:hypothetical protein